MREERERHALAGDLGGKLKLGVVLDEIAGRQLRTGERLVGVHQYRRVALREARAHDLDKRIRRVVEDKPFVRDRDEI